MGSVNKIILIGNVGKDPEVTYSPSGMAFAKFSVATSERKKNDQGGWDEKTDWHNVTLFGKTAEAAGNYLKKGSQVYIEGRIEYSSSERDGVTRYFTNILGSRMQMLGAKGDSPTQQPAQSTATHVVNNSAPAPDNSEETLPF
jgi:single-strand DNA-binding protein